MDDKTYQVALSPDLHISPEEFATAWNENSEISYIYKVENSDYIVLMVA
jgi:hypothetical protein